MHIYDQINKGLLRFFFPLWYLQSLSFRLLVCIMFNQLLSVELVNIYQLDDDVPRIGKCTTQCCQNKTKMHP